MPDDKPELTATHKGRTIAGVIFVGLLLIGSYWTGRKDGEHEARKALHIVACNTYGDGSQLCAMTP